MNAPPIDIFLVSKLKTFFPHDGNMVSGFVGKIAICPLLDIALSLTTTYIVGV